MPADDAAIGARHAVAAVRTLGALRKARREKAVPVLAKLADLDLAFAAQNPAYPAEVRDLARLQLSGRVGGSAAGRLVATFPRLLAPPPHKRPRVLALGSVDRRLLAPFRVLRIDEGTAAGDASALARAARALATTGPFAGAVRVRFEPAVSSFGLRLMAHSADAIVASFEAEPLFETLTREGLASRLLVVTPEGALERVTAGLPAGASVFALDRVHRESRLAFHAALRATAARRET